MSRARLARAAGIVTARGLDALLVTSLENLRYLSGFTGSDGALLVTADGQGRFLTDARYETQAAQETRDVTIAVYRRKLEGIADAVRGAGVARVGFEAAALSYEAAESLRRLLAGPESGGGGVALEPVPAEALWPLRMRKEPEELERMRRAIAIAAEALAHTLELAREGVRELDLALELEFAMRRRGAERIAFDTIVASGIRSALPHGRASEKKLAAGEFLTIDYGACYQGYHSDETWTGVLGEATPEQRRVFAVVKEAHDAGIAAVRPGVRASEVDAAARRVIEAAGYGRQFGHGTGHGIGLAVHEAPAVNATSPVVLEPGMVITVEPGIYLPGWGGVRLEDMVLVTETGAEVLTRTPKELRSLG
ncbi:MAG TPA: Xaa-Pro peptidase family protein [Thermodesulfobacteriota bacterium]|nr:Xaa-Pro peptidase family protein [Thermodesulfobacteriota bacterium]